MKNKFIRIIENLSVVFIIEKLRAQHTIFTFISDNKKEKTKKYGIPITLVFI